ncbi:carbon-nitrogen hydrolase family protein [Rugamonas sp. FT82W]|uniref:Carbon-nitrogen hydrolase family protein n=1 Tax=Duganella vulcania TaxID=2692166 RepID=A0A845G2T4_9BURK|nr:carbon-nitrogen hydrolase family protein [Duganella vulcania]MYM88634.1 carbon-nitrogen hydrolase family protein [Duganella vulcania]
MRKFRVAAFQRKPVFDDVARVAARVGEDIAWCESQGVDLALFPECYVQGYTTDRAMIARRAMAVDGAPFADLLSALPVSGVDAVLGFVELRADGYYNSAAVIGDGLMKGVYSKNHPNERGFLPGRDAPVFHKSGVVFGINICYDANFPESARRLSGQGARLICYPLNNMLAAATAEKWRSRSVENLRQRAVETGCWVASSDVVGTAGEQISFGCTCIVDPQGTVVARVAEGAEGVAVFDMDGFDVP